LTPVVRQSDEFLGLTVEVREEVDFLQLLIDELLEGVEFVFVVSHSDEIHFLEAVVGEEVVDLRNFVVERNGVVPDASVEVT